MANEVQVLTVETSDGGQVIRRKNISDITPKSASGVALSVSGLVAEFSDGADGLPLTSLSVGIEAVQSGSGDPSPQNIRAISGWTGAKIRRTAKNLWGGDAVLADVKDAIPAATVDAAARTVIYASTASASHVICGETSGRQYGARFKENTRYTFIITGYKASSIGANLRVWFTDGSGSGHLRFPAYGEKSILVYPTPAGKSVYSFTNTNSSGVTTLYADECGIFEGDLTEGGTLTNEEVYAKYFEPYQGEEVAVDWEAAAGEVYGGTLNVLSGELSVTHRKFTVTAITTFSDKYKRAVVDYPRTTPFAADSEYGMRCNMLKTWTGGTNQIPVDHGKTFMGEGGIPRFTFKMTGVDNTEEAYNAKLAELSEAGTPLEFIVEMATPTVYQLTPAQLSTLYGENRIFADSGDAELTYTADTKLYIDNGDAADRAVIAPDAPGGVASRNYAIGEFLTVGAALYRVTAAIASGGAVTPGVNVVATTVSEQLAALWAAVNS